MFPQKITYEETLDSLSIHEYRSPLELADEIASTRGIDGLAPMGLYPHLREMQRDGLVDARKRKPGLRRKYEYKLTSSGLRKRVDLTSNTLGIEATLDPSSA